MGIAKVLESDVADIFATQWSMRKGEVVPEAEDIRLGNDAVTLEEAAVLYADLADSTELVQQRKSHFAAEVYKTFLHCASKIIKNNQGQITAFDGDRVMAVFIGSTKRSNAAKAALNINHAVQKIINPALKAEYPSNDYVVRHAVGVDVSNVFVARTGIRGSNDLVWVGRAANYAAKLCALRESTYASFITSEVFERLREDVKFAGEPKRCMWEKWHWDERGIDIYRSNLRWTP